MDNRIRPIEDLITEGLAERFQEVFGRPLQYTSSTDSKSQAVKLKAENKRGPFLFARTTGYSVDTERGSPQTLLRRGVIGQPLHDNVTASKFSAIPIITTYQIQFLTQDATLVKEYCKRWLMTSVAGSLKLSVLYGPVAADVSIELDQELSVPTRSEGTEANEFVVESSLRVRGYMSTNQLQTVQAVTTVEVDGVLVPEEAYKALNQAGRDKVAIHLFKRDWSTTPGPDGARGDRHDPGV